MTSTKNVRLALAIDSDGNYGLAWPADEGSSGTVDYYNSKFGRKPRPMRVVIIAADVDLPCVETVAASIEPAEPLNPTLGASLAIMTLGDRPHCLLKRGKSLPASTTYECTTAEDDQTLVDIRLVNHETRAELSRLRLEVGPDQARRPLIEVSLCVDVDGLAHITATDEKTGRSVTGTAKINVGLPAPRPKAKPRVRSRKPAPKRAKR